MAIDKPELSSIMIEATFVKCHMDASGANGGNQGTAVSKRGINTEIHITVDARGSPLKIPVSDGNVHDSKKAEELMQDFKAKYLIADKGYDSKTIVEYARKHGMEIVIPSRSSAKNPRNYNKELYKRRHLDENSFMKIKRFRSISTRYTKNISSFRAYLAIASIMTYCKLL